MTFYHYNELEYIGKTGFCREIIADTATSTEISDSEITSGTVLQTGYLEFAQAGMKEGGTGRITEILTIINNGTTAAPAIAFKILFFNQPPTSQTSGSALSLSAADVTAYQGSIVLSTTAALSTYIAHSLTTTDFIYNCYPPTGTTAGNSTLYAIVLCNTTNTFDALATVRIDLKVQKD